VFLLDTRHTLVTDDEWPTHSTPITGNVAALPLDVYMDELVYKPLAVHVPSKPTRNNFPFNINVK
jgi:hypothetical protein